MRLVEARGLASGRCARALGRDAGLDWYLFPNAWIMFNYVHADVSSREAVIATVPTNLSGTGDIVQTRLQIDF